MEVVVFKVNVAVWLGSGGKNISGSIYGPLRDFATFENIFVCSHISLGVLQRKKKDET